MVIDDVPRESRHLCQECLDKKHLAEYEAAQKAELERLNAQPRTEWIADSHIPIKFRGKTFENFDPQLQRRAFEVMQGYTGEKGIVLSSPDLYGVGKTHLAAALAMRIIQKTDVAVIRDGIRLRACPVYLEVEASVLMRIRATNNHHTNDDEVEYETEEDVYRDLIHVRHLIIDDVGKVRPKDYSFLQGVYFQIIDGRYNAERPIILTTNLSFEELENHIGGACADRLKEMCAGNLIKMVGKSQRR